MRVSGTQIDQAGNIRFTLILVLLLVTNFVPSASQVAHFLSAATTFWKSKLMNTQTRSFDKPYITIPFSCGSQTIRVFVLLPITRCLAVIPCDSTQTRTAHNDQP